MGFINRVSYLTGLLRMLPFGLVFLFLGINGLVKYRTVDRFYEINGELIYSGIQKVKSGSINMDALVIDIVENKMDTIRCHSFYKGHHVIAKILKGDKGDSIVVWVDSNMNNKIKQIKYSNEYIIEYKGATGLYLFLLFIGIVYSVITLWYLVAHPEHLFKKNNS